MDLLVSLGITLLLLLQGCASSSYNEKDIHKRIDAKQRKQQEERYRTGSQEIKAFEEGKRRAIPKNVPQLVLPPVYQEVSVFNEKKTTISAQGAQFGTLLHTVSKVAGLNLIIDNDVPSNMPITISVKDANTQEVLDILMNISGCYYELKGNLLHVKSYMSKSFVIPYTHTTSSFKTDLGGDILNSATQNSGGSSNGSSSNSSGGGSNGIKGDFSLNYDNPQEINSFYTQIEDNIKSMLSPDGHYTLNKFSGVLNVRDHYKNVQNISNFIATLKKQINRQVLIEAKILEVTLNDAHALGVSWEAVADDLAKVGDKLLLQQGLALSGSVAGTITYTTDNFAAIINALDQSGDVDTLSNPRIKVLSGQSAIISSGKLVPFWEKEVQTVQGTGGSASNTQVTYNRRDVLNGLTMGVTPTIMEDGRIMLNIVPITSSIEDVVNYYDEDGRNVATAPILNIKEAGTVIYAKDNDLVLIGGLINNTVSKHETKVPILGDIPGLGALFRNTQNEDEKRELVILIRLKVIE